MAATPESVKKLVDLGFELAVETSAGVAAGYVDTAYAAAGATLCTASEALAAPIVLKVRPPSLDEVPRFTPQAVLVSLVQPERNPGLLDALAARSLTVLALERIPRVTRAQKMDVLSSMGNLAGYRAVVEAAQYYQGCFGAQVTAAGTVPPAKVLVIGAGVAGLAACAAAKAMGAEVRAFDTRAAAREQIESLGARFLTITMQESGEGQGGYAKQMSQEFIAAEWALFKQQAADVNIMITTALVPGTKAPMLVPTEVVEALRPGSVVVDMAAEQGGNCELCRPGEVVDHAGVKILGFTDLASRMANTASRFFANNLVHLLHEMGDGAAFKVDLENDVIRPALLAHGGAKLAPPPPKATAPSAAAATGHLPPPPGAKSKQPNILTSTGRAWGTTVGGMAVIAVLFALGRFAPRDFLQHSTVFILACFVGWQVVWSVTPALHTPLMSVTNAISGIIIVGGMVQIGAGLDAATILGALAVLVAAINVSGGFLVTQRMLRMFHREVPASAAKNGGKR